MNKANRTLIVLALIVVAGGLSIVGTHALLSPRIAEEQRKASEAVYFDTLQLKPNDNLQLDATLTTNDSDLLGLRSPQPVYIARQDNRIVGFVLPLTAREGYADAIDLLLGVDAHGTVISVRVLSHRETRGLGDKIEAGKSQWLEQFRGATFDEAQKSQWQLRSDGGAFDGITGATVTSRAVVKAIQQGLAYFAAHRDELVGDAGNE